MNYGSAQVAQDPDQKSILKELDLRFQEVIKEEGSVIIDIEDRLHSILNCRTPPSEDKKPSPVISDALGQMRDHIDQVAMNNIRLIKILNHLSKII
jgi:hypothetical protein